MFPRVTLVTEGLQTARRVPELWLSLEPAGLTSQAGADSYAVASLVRTDEDTDHTRLWGL